MTRATLSTCAMLTAVCALAITSTSAVGGVVFLGGSRQVSAQMSGGALQVDAAPTAFGSWTGSATSLAPGSAMARVTASQTSTVTATSIIGNGTITYSRLMQDTTTGEGTSVIDYFLRVDQPTEYSLVGSVAEGSTGTIILQGNNGFLISSRVVNQSGTLPIGVYEFTARMSLSVPQLGPGTAAWNVAFTVPAPGAAALAMLGVACRVGRRTRDPR